MIIVVAAAMAKAVQELISAALSALSYGKALVTIVSVLIIGLGIIAALNQLGVATTVTRPILIAVRVTGGSSWLVSVVR